MLIAERFGLNHETKTNEEGRCVRIYKGLATLLEGTEARRRSVASPNPAGLSNGGIGSHAGTQRYGATGRSRPSSMLYPDTMNMNGFNSPLASHQQQRMGSFQSSQQGYQNELSRVRSYTHSQGVSAHFQQHSMQQQQQQPVQQQHQPIQQDIGLQQQQQAFPRANDAPGRASGNYGGYPSRLYQDSAVVPYRHPRGPEMSQNFVARQQMHQQDERQIQRQTQLKVLQQNRQRRLSSTAENNNDTPSTPVAVATAAAAAAAAASPAESLSSSTFKIEKPLSKAIPIVRPPGDSDSKYRSLPASPLIPNLAVEQTKQH
ncbi:hypothetical protein BX661DRAFT_172903 [Kickxella alabastrina]|uniref:uncharacterized protein n=1 Tax=Kickxella alabastrina TaxID=61397 RepID=UPI002220886C|nr:uncharacterized protein BX661DRAFT_172903 [Kickxella alabastrina]KAI7823157.1 hypothetical protein BX661DRAFT_172903 [Kickxella alabastrina]